MCTKFLLSNIMSKTSEMLHEDGWGVYAWTCTELKHLYTRYVLFLFVSVFAAISLSHECVFVVCVLCSEKHMQNVKYFGNCQVCKYGYCMIE